jgi:hypothetical protein
MKALALLLLLVPLALMVVAFWLLARLLSRHGRELSPEYAADGKRVLLYAPRASLRSIQGATVVPGPGTLVLTERHLVFERFFPRREFRIELERIAGLQERRGAGRSAELVVQWTGGERGLGEGCVLEVPDAVAWVEAIGLARPCRSPSPPEPRRSTGPPGR